MRVTEKICCFKPGEWNPTVFQDSDFEGSAGDFFTVPSFFAMRQFQYYYTAVVIKNKLNRDIMG